MTKAAATLPTPYSVSDGLFSPTRPNDDDETWSVLQSSSNYYQIVSNRRLAPVAVAHWVDTTLDIAVLSYILFIS